MIHLLIIILSIFPGITAVRGTEAASLFTKGDPLVQVQTNKKYITIRDGLHKDEKGNLYFKTKDWSQEDSPVDRYIYVVYSERFRADGIKEMKAVIDPDTFKAIGSSYYKDKSNLYYFKEMSDGGTMAIVDGADLNSFKIIKATTDSDAKDKYNSYYQGRKIK